MIRELKFKILCQRFSDDVFRFSRSMLGNAADAEDATQEVLLKLWRHAADVSMAHARGWLMKTTRNHCLNMLRLRSGKAGVASDDDGYPEEVVDCKTLGAESVYYGKELRDRIDRALNRLPESLRSIFVLYEVNGLKYREISESLDIPVNSVKVYLLRARSKLKEILSQEAES
jgi:RNA polymerase sigma-70 factor (ECF subfamily)